MKYFLKRLTQTSPIPHNPTPADRYADYLAGAQKVLGNNFPWAWTRDPGLDPPDEEDMRQAAAFEFGQDYVSS